MNKRSALLVVLAIILAAFVGMQWVAKTGPEQPATEVATGPVHLRLQSFALALNPLKMADVESRQVATLLYAGLVTQNQDGTTDPAVAEKWEHVGDEWKFTLKSGLTFSNGKVLDVSDVVASLCNAMQPSSPWAWALASIEHSSGVDGKSVDCAGIQSVGGNVVRVVESRPVPWFLDAISGPAGWILPSGQVEEQAYGVMPGLGPYTVKEIVPDTRVVLSPRTGGSAISAGTGGVQFDLIVDDSVAAGAFAEGNLDVLDLTSPGLVERLVDVETGALKATGTLVKRKWDRVRIAIINEKSLVAKGFTDAQAHSFIQVYSGAIDRRKIAQNTHGISSTMITSFPPVPKGEAPAGGSSQTATFPSVSLTVITEPDAYSDLIAASLPTRIGPVSIDYRGVDKGLLIQSLIKGDFDIASILIEATTHSPEFWKSFFTPGNPFTAFGKPIPGLENVDVADPEGVEKAAELIEQSGNWVGILQESRWQAIAPGIGGIKYSPSGQTDYATIERQ